MFFQVLQVSGVFSLEYTFRNGHMTQRQKPMSIDKKIINSNSIFALLQSILFTLFSFDKIVWFEISLALIFNAIKHVREYTGATCHV